MATAHPASASTSPDARSRAERRKRWWLALPALIAVAFIAFALPPYLTFDPTRSRIPPPADVAKTVGSSRLVHRGSNR